ncbi:MAG: universal stress protein [Bacteroidales bacterium]|nr:universal stress protein [Bacteroidales bacterium]
MKNILVPIDFSEDSINALEFAINIANKFNANIRMLHVKSKYSNYESTYNFKNYNNILNNSIKDYFEIKLKNYKNKLNGKLDYKIRDGKIYREITNQAKYDDAELIVMGTHGVSGFEELWVGSNAYRVVTNATCPVVTIRNDFKNKEIKKIVLPIDTTEETRQKVPFISLLAKAFDAEIFVVTVRESEIPDIIKKLTQYSEQVIEYISNKGIKCQSYSLVGTNITDITIDYALKIEADLIAAMTEQTENPKNIFLGAYAQQMVNHSTIPVISLRPA